MKVQIGSAICHSGLKKIMTAAMTTPTPKANIIKFKRLTLNDISNDMDNGSPNVHICVLI